MSKPLRWTIPKRATMDNPNAYAKHVVGALAMDATRTFVSWQVGNRAVIALQVGEDLHVLDVTVRREAYVIRWAERAKVPK